MKYIIDIDGTIATKVKGDNYSAAKPIPEVIANVNALYDAGHHITYWTARGTMTGKDWLALTVRQLKKWGCKYHAVSMGKKQYDVWVDDKAIRPSELVQGYKLTPGYMKPGKPYPIKKVKFKYDVGLIAFNERVLTPFVADKKRKGKK